MSFILLSFIANNYSYFHLSPLALTVREQSFRRKSCDLFFLPLIPLSWHRPSVWNIWQDKPWLLQEKFKARPSRRSGFITCHHHYHCHKIMVDCEDAPTFGHNKLQRMSKCDTGLNDLKIYSIWRNVRIYSLPVSEIGSHYVFVYLHISSCTVYSYIILLTTKAREMP